MSNLNLSTERGKIDMKYLLGFVVAIAILLITAVVFQTYGLFISSKLNSMGGISEFKYIAIGMTKLIPLILGIWLIKLSWKKITTEKD